MSYTLQITSFRPFQWHTLEIGRAVTIMFCRGILGNWGSGIFPEWEVCFAPWRPCFDFKHSRLCTVATFFRYLFYCSLDCGVQGDFCSRQKLLWGTCCNSGRNLLQTFHKYRVSSLYQSDSTWGTLFLPCWDWRCREAKRSRVLLQGPSVWAPGCQCQPWVLTFAYTALRCRMFPLWCSCVAATTCERL